MHEPDGVLTGAQGTKPSSAGTASICAASIQETIMKQKCSVLNSKVTGPQATSLKLHRLWEPVAQRPATQSCNLDI